MAQQEYIKDLYENEEVSLREIARRTKLSFQTVQKYAYKEDWSEENCRIWKQKIIRRW